MKKLLLRCLGVSLLTVSICCLTSCDLGSTPKNEVKVGGRTMGTFYNITVVGEYPGGAEQLKYDSEKVLDKINKEMSTFDKKSMLSKFNQSKSVEPFEISQDLADVFVESLRSGHDLNGATDVTVGPLVNAWGFGPQKFTHEPTEQEILEAKKLIGLDKLHVEISADKATVRKDIPDLYVDLATVGEGFGADKLAQLMDNHGVQNYMVSVAGAIRTKGVNSRGTDWVVAIEHPTTEQQVGQRLEIPVCTKGQAISTSGSYRNFIISKDGKRESHIIDPNTGRPIEHNTVSVTVIGPTALWTDAVDTGFMVMGSEKALVYANERNIPIYTIIKTKDGFESHYSRAMSRYLECE
jgi:FAD:protein FMN transferase